MSLLRAGEQLIRERGPASALAGLTLADLAREMGMSSASLRRTIRTRRQWEAVTLPALGDRAAETPIYVALFKGRAELTQGAGFRRSLEATLRVETAPGQPPHVLAWRHLLHPETATRERQRRKTLAALYEAAIYENMARKGRRPGSTLGFDGYGFAMSVVHSGAHLACLAQHGEIDDAVVAEATDVFLDVTQAVSEPAPRPYPPDYEGPDGDIAAGSGTDPLRSAVIEASLRLMTEHGVSHGLADLRTRPLARRAGVSVGLLYHQWGSLGDYHAALLSHMLAMRAEALGSALARGARTTPDAARAGLAHWIRDPTDLMLLLSNTDVEPRLSGIVRRHMGECAGILVDQLGIPRARATVVLGTVLGAMLMLSFDAEHCHMLQRRCPDGRGLGEAIISIALGHD